MSHGHLDVTRGVRDCCHHGQTAKESAGHRVHRTRLSLTTWMAVGKFIISLRTPLNEHNDTCLSGLIRVKWGNTQWCWNTVIPQCVSCSLDHAIHHPPHHH